MGFLSLLGASPALVVRPWFPRLVPLLVVPRSNRLLSLSLWFFLSLRWPTPPPTRPPVRVHLGELWRACRRRLLLLSLLLRPCLLGLWPLLFFGRRRVPRRPPPRFCSSAFGAFAVAVDFRRRLGGERRIAPRQTLQQMPPDTTERIPRTGIRAMIPGSRREWVGRQMRLVHKILCTKSPRAVETAQGRARADRMGNPVRKTGAKRIKSPEMPSKCARPDQRRAKRGIPNPKRPAERPKTGCQMSSAPSIGAVCVRSAAAGGIVEIPPPTIGANVVKFSLASHTAGVESPVRRALVRQNHHAACTSSEWAQLRAGLPAPIRQPSRHIKLDLSANTSIRHGKPKGKIDLTFFVFYNCLRSAAANQPTERGRRIYPRSVRDGRQRWPTSAARNALDSPRLATWSGQPPPPSRPVPGSGCRACASASSAP